MRVMRSGGAGGVQAVARPQTRRIATAAMAAITSNSVRSGRFIVLGSAELGPLSRRRAPGSGTESSSRDDQQ